MVRSLGRLSPVLIIAAVFGTASGIAVAEQRVQPSARPSRPTPSEEVVIRFRARQTLDGVYHAEARHRPGDPACDLRKSRTVIAPRKGRVVRLRLLPPRIDGDPDAREWCVGTYRAKVFFKQVVRCPPFLNCGDSAARSIGSTTFTVVAEQ